MKIFFFCQKLPNFATFLLDFYNLEHTRHTLQTAFVSISTALHFTTSTF